MYNNVMTFNLIWAVENGPTTEFSDKWKSFTVSGWVTHCDHSSPILSSCVPVTYMLSHVGASLYLYYTFPHSTASWNSNQSFALFEFFLLKLKDTHNSHSGHIYEEQRIIDRFHWGLIVSNFDSLFWLHIDAYYPRYLHITRKHRYFSIN